MFRTFETFLVKAAENLVRPRAGRRRRRLFEAGRRSLSACSSPFTEAVPPRRDWSIRGVPPSVNGLVHSLSVPHLREWTGSFAECTHFVNALHAYMRTHVCTLGWPYPVEFNQRN